LALVCSLPLVHTHFFVNDLTATKVGAIVAGQTSVKAPEQAAFEKYLPADVHIISCHSLHGPTISPVGQPLVRSGFVTSPCWPADDLLQVLIQHRGPNEALHLVENILRPLGSRFVYLSYEDHDRVTANVQAVTHAAFLRFAESRRFHARSPADGSARSMGTAWSCSRSYPWEHGSYVGGIENVKVNIMLRIYSNKWHVYAGLAILNPAAQVQIDQYARSATELYKLMLARDLDGLRARMLHARDVVFAPAAAASRPLLLADNVLDRFALCASPHTPTEPPRNSHLSLLAMADCWAALGIQPFVHLELAATPIFRMWLGVAESLFRDSARLERAVDAAVHDTSHRADDLEFVVGARGWAQCVAFGSFELYRRRFEQTAEFFRPRFDEANKLGADMIKAIVDSSPGKK
jgi:prephenate dehydrogenase (NADP+)